MTTTTRRRGWSKNKVKNETSMAECDLAEVGQVGHLDDEDDGEDERKSGQKRKRPNGKSRSKDAIVKEAEIKPEIYAEVDLSEVGQVGHLDEPDGPDQDGHDGTLRRSSRLKRRHRELESSRHSDRETISSIKKAKSKGDQHDKEPQAKPTRPSVRRKQSSIPPEDVSAFPSLSLKLHGLQADKQTFYGLVQEILTPDVFGMTIVCILLNQTTGRAAVPVFYDLMELYPTPKLLANADLKTLTEMLQPIGLHNIRAKRLIDFAIMWCQQPPQWGVTHPSRVSLPKGVAGAWRQRGNDVVDDLQLDQKIPVDKSSKTTRNVYPPTEISHLPGVGRYALDSFLLFKPDNTTHTDMASVQVSLLSGSKADKKPTSSRWEAILAKRETCGESRDVGRLLPPPDIQKETHLEHDVWRHLLPLDKELRAYLAWRIVRQEQIDGGKT
ncbi:unnamed protein product [Sympodiomycopsis kandeliae]